MGWRVLALCVVTMLCLTGCGGRPTFDSQDAFEKAVCGKTKAEIIKALGKPNDRQNYGRFRNGKNCSDVWSYYNMVKDPFTGEWAVMKVKFLGEEALETGLNTSY